MSPMNALIVDRRERDILRDMVKVRLDSMGMPHDREDIIVTSKLQGLLMRLDAMQFGPAPRTLGQAIVDGAFREGAPR